MNLKNCALISVVVALMTGLLTASTFLFEARDVRAIYSEQGFFEQASPIIWIIAGLYALWHVRGGGRAYLVLGFTFFALAGREWHMHKAFTSDSILKINFYQDHGFGAEQLFGGLAALVLVGLFVAALVILIRYIIANRGYQTRGGQFMIAGLGMLVLSKISDRAPSVLREDYAVIMDEQWSLVLLALEEGFEFFCPVFILIGVIYKIKSEAPQALLP